MSNKKSERLVGVALFTAIVVLLQLLAIVTRSFGLPFSLTFVLVPIVVGAALYGVGAGAWFGFVFGMAVLVSGDAYAFLTVNSLGTILTVLVKGAVAGLGAGLVYRALEKFNRTLAVFAAAAVCPLLNTGIFLIGCKLFFMETLAGWADGAGFGSDVAAYMFLGLVGVNFLVEFAVNLILAPVIHRLILIGKKA
ncbi:MAG: ECF transporter S component [Clostridia bacterium]|nr:ECF transporter S component [Clostridia bacterium]